MSLLALDGRAGISSQKHSQVQADLLGRNGEGKYAQAMDGGIGRCGPVDHTFGWFRRSAGLWGARSRDDDLTPVLMGNLRIDNERHR